MHNIFRILSDNSIMHGFYLSMSYTSLLLPNDCQKNGKLICRYVKGKRGKRKRKPGFWIKKIDKARNFLLEEIKHNDLMSEKHQIVCRVLNYIDHFLVFVPAVSGSVSVSAFVSLVVVPVGIASSAVGLKICSLTAGIKKIIKKTRKTRGYSVVNKN